MKRVVIDESIAIPAGITVSVKDKVISVKGKKGEIVKDFSHAKKIDINVVGKEVLFHADFPRRDAIALTKTLRNLVGNMFVGVQEGYEYRMKLVYSHFPITVDPPKKGSTEILIKNFIGERAPRITHSIGNVDIKANKEEVIVTGPDKELVGQTCANIQKKCKIKEKDKRVFQDGVFVSKKMLGNKVLWEIK